MVYPDPISVVAIGRRVEDLLANPENKEWSSISSELCGGTREAKAFALFSEEGTVKGKVASLKTSVDSESIPTAKKAVIRGKIVQLQKTVIIATELDELTAKEGKCNLSNVI
ncbi:alanine--tRNA ligase-like [Gossypium australe]|uniref:Alanine--tRNA ligase-like n=1 Tax=Gossypium australe TaxID=47621 RepID=A0A5B6V060_9ROSI|nr:alanine--tRNA ligase-like [Gossypium australe]